MRPGDEALGLTAVLLSLGIRAVVAAVARVPDDVAAETMTAYHQELARGTEFAEALARVTRNGPLIARAFTTFGSQWRAAPALPELDAPLGSPGGAAKLGMIAGDTPLVHGLPTHPMEG